MATQNPMDDIIAEFDSEKTSGKRGKSNHTLYLDSGNFVALQTYCRDRDIKVSEVVDRLISQFIQTLIDKGRLPADANEKKVS